MNAQQQPESTIISAHCTTSGVVFDRKDGSFYTVRYQERPEDYLEKQKANPYPNGRWTSRKPQPLKP